MYRASSCVAGVQPFAGEADRADELCLALQIDKTWVFLAPNALANLISFTAGSTAGLERNAHRSFIAVAAAPSPCEAEWRMMRSVREENKLGQYHCNNRVYDINQGRWTSTDQANVPSPNLLGYCGNLPVARSDPMGLKFYIPADDERARKLMMRMAWFSCLRLKFTDETYEDVDDTDPDGPKKIKRKRVRVTVDKEYDGACDCPMVFEGGDKEGTIVKITEPGYDEDLAYTDAEECMCKCSDTLKKRLKLVMSDDHDDITLAWGNYKTTKSKIVMPADENPITGVPGWNGAGPCSDKNSIVLQFNHELYRAMNDAKKNSKAGEVAKHSHGDDYWNDPVWVDGELPVRRELGADTNGHDEIPKGPRSRKLGEDAQ